MRKCPECELNYIKEGEELCEICAPPRKVFGKLVTDYNATFDKLINGRAYGTNTKTIYLKCCDAFGWNKLLRTEFGWQRPCYAELVDNENNVWFITDSNLTNSKGSSGKWKNEVLGDGKTIIEHWEAYSPTDNPSDRRLRISFVKKDGEYVFLGVYKRIKQNKSLRVYERISSKYPIN